MVFPGEPTAGPTKGKEAKGKPLMFEELESKPQNSFPNPRSPPGRGNQIQ